MLADHIASCSVCSACITLIAAEYGLPVLHVVATGCVPAIIAMTPAGAIFYGSFDVLKHRHLKRMEQQMQEQEALQQPQPQHAKQRAATQPVKAVSQGTGQISSNHPHLDLPAAYTLLYGALAGAAAELFVYPLEVGPHLDAARLQMVVHH